MMDSEGRVVEFNPAAERTFGYRRADVVGRSLAELIIPPRLRERHYRGLAHYLETGESKVLGRRVEVTAIRADGREFPVELAITRVLADGPPLLLAYLRDISDRVRSEQLRNLRFAVTHLAPASEVSSAGRGVLRAVCEQLLWHFGAFWCVDRSSETLQCVATWSGDEKTVEVFDQASRDRKLRRGEGLPGRVWATGQSTWVLDVQRDRNFPRASAAARAGLRSAFACPILGREGTYGVIEFFTHNIQDPDEELLETMGTVAAHVGEFIERQQSEQKLRETEARFRALMDQAPFSIQIFSPDGRTLHVNPAWSALWGVTLEQIADYNVLADPQLKQKGVLPYLQRAFNGESVDIPAIRYDPNETIPNRSRHADPVRYVSAVAYPLKDEAGLVQQVVLVHEDITARRLAETALRESEEKLRLLADTIPQLAWMAKPDGYIFWYNKRWYEYTGTTPREMEGWGWQSVHDPELLPEVLARWKSSIENGEPFEMVFPLRGADGTFRPFLTRVNALRDPDGRILYWFGTNTDISELKRMEEALRDADRRKDEFLAMLAHELRNPLAPIVNALQIMKIGRLDGSTSQQVGAMIERQVQQLVRLVDDLLDVSRVVRGKIELRKEPTELAGVVARAVETAQPTIDARGHRLEVALPGESLIVDADPVRLAQAVSNLLNNAAKFTEENGHIFLTARREADYVVLLVRDNGCGIAPEALPHIFELFVQADTGVGRASGGLGIGLTLVRTLVEMHDGSVSAFSAGLGKGSEFTMRLPLSAHRSPRLSHTQESARSVAASGLRVLVVDDNEDAADSLAMLLRLQGHQVMVRYKGRAAVRVVPEYRPHIIFLDLGMPGMDGYETARRVRASFADVVLVALTGWGQKEDRRRTADAGFDHHLVKPADPAAIQALLASLGTRA